MAIQQVYDLAVSRSVVTKPTLEISGDDLGQRSVRPELRVYGFSDYSLQVWLQVAEVRKSRQIPREVTH
jgi:hypothetical protein